MSGDYSELLSLLRGKASDKGKTTQEIAEELGIGIRRAHRLIREAQASGMMTTGKRQVDSIDGRRIAVPVYCVRAARATDDKADGGAHRAQPADHNAPKKKRKPAIHGR